MRSMHISRAAVGVVALLLTFLVGGCDDEESPPEPIESSSEPTSPPTSTTTEPTPTGPVEPTLPTEAEAETKAGAEAFIDYYWSVVSFAQISGETRLLESLADRTCAGCKGGVESIREVYRQGGRIIGGEISLVNATTDRTPSGAWNVAAEVMIQRRRVTGAGSLNEVSRPGNVDFLVGLTFQGRSWSVTFLDVA